MNYPAREYGVNRFNCTLEEAKKRCPDLVLIHVATYGVRDMDSDSSLVIPRQSITRTPQQRLTKFRWICTEENLKRSWIFFKGN